MKGTDGMKENIFNNDAITLLIEKYQQLKKKGLKGELGKTAQYWLIYTEMVSKLHQFQFAINTNNLPLRIDAWEYFLPLFCNQQNTLCSVRNLLYSTAEEFGFDASRSI